MSTDNDRNGYVYFVMGGDRIKIGFSRDPYRRVAAMQTSSAEPLYLLGVQPGKLSDEKWLHNRFEKLWIHGEWFDYTGDLASYINMVLCTELPSWGDPFPSEGKRGEKLKPADPLTPDEIVGLFGAGNYQLLSELHEEYAQGVTLRALALQLIRDGRVHPSNEWMTYGLRAALNNGVCKSAYIIACALKGSVQ